MGVKYLLTTPEPPTWWARYKTVVWGVVGLLIGLQLSGTHGSTPAPSPTPGATTRSPSPHRPTPSLTPRKTAPTAQRTGGPAPIQIGKQKVCRL
ncbi:hypothetical protein [Streptomyces sp. RKAG293]|uniref:hypothetical protein n=1 Tax=Streptomyces sp. RKAG293 TaxID=2893403 RepID=UPI0020335808|nr:hypothetical protein [Streptomyces sp. RKAG293]MCM2424274.1 hypothetical protein [Streptomyces sp. RKAG293]